MSELIISGKTFKKSTYSPVLLFRCVSVSIQPNKVLVTHSSGDKPILEFTHDEWDAFLKGAKNNEFELTP